MSCVGVVCLVDRIVSEKVGRLIEIKAAAKGWNRQQAKQATSYATGGVWGVYLTRAKRRE